MINIHLILSRNNVMLNGGVAFKRFNIWRITKGNEDNVLIWEIQASLLFCSCFFVKLHILSNLCTYDFLIGKEELKPKIFQNLCANEIPENTERYHFTRSQKCSLFSKSIGLLQIFFFLWLTSDDITR